MGLPQRLIEMTEPINQPGFVRRINKAMRFAHDGKFAQAVQLLRSLAGEFPKAGSVRCYLAWSLSKLGQNKEALKHSRQAIILSPKSEYASLAHYLVLCQNRKWIEALDEMKRFVMIRPSKVYTKIIKSWETDSQRPTNKRKRGRKRG